MKTAIILTDGIKQIMFTPENDNEKEALRMITPDDDIELVIKTGNFSDAPEKYGAQVSTCQGGYLRLYEDFKSTMFVLTPKKK